MKTWMIWQTIISMMRKLFRLKERYRGTHLLIFVNIHMVIWWTCRVVLCLSLGKLIQEEKVSRDSQRCVIRFTICMQLLFLFIPNVIVSLSLCSLICFTVSRFWWIVILKTKFLKMRILLVMIDCLSMELCCHLIKTTHISITLKPKFLRSYFTFSFDCKYIYIQNLQLSTATSFSPNL